MPEHPAQAFYGHSLVDGQDGKAVSGAMIVKPEINGRQMEAIRNLKR